MTGSCRRSSGATTLAGYDFGPSHPMAPVRVELAVRLARDLGVLEPASTCCAPRRRRRRARRTGPRPGVHRRGQGAPAPTDEPDLARGLGTADNPAFAGMHEASAHVVGATRQAARAVWSTGRSEHAVNLAGGLHHAMADHASGFCVYNDVAVAIRGCSTAALERVGLRRRGRPPRRRGRGGLLGRPSGADHLAARDGPDLFPGTGDRRTWGAGRGGLRSTCRCRPAPTTGAGWRRFRR